MKDDGIEARIRYPRPPRLRIGDEVLEFPIGTTDDEVRAVVNTAWAIHMKQFTVNHDPGDEDTER